MKSIGLPPTLLALTIQKGVAIEVVWMVQTWLIIVSSMHYSCGTTNWYVVVGYISRLPSHFLHADGVILHLLIHDLSVV